MAKIATNFECDQSLLCGWQGGSNVKRDCFGIVVCPECGNDNLTPVDGVHPNLVDTLDKSE